MTGERNVLKLSAFACLGIGSFGLAFAAITNSEAILLDGTFNLAYFAMGLFTLKVLTLIERGDDERFPYGYGFFEPLVNGVKGTLVLGVSVMALFSAVEALFSGGREIAMGWAVLYGAVASTAGWTLALVTKRAKDRISSPLVHADAVNWIVNALVSTSVLAAFVLVFVLDRMGEKALVPYMDPLVVTLVVLLSIGVPVRMAWGSLMGLLNRAAEAPAVATTRAAVEQGLAGLPIGRIAIRVIKPGRTHMVAVHVQLEAGASPAMRELDAARHRIGEALLARDPNVILDVIFTEDPHWFAALPPAG